MTFGMSLETFTLVHVIISLLGIGSGAVVVYGMVANRRFNRLTIFFLVTTAATSLTGFLFPFREVTPGIVLGILSCAVLLPATLARYAFSLRGSWRWIYAAGAVIALYFNVFVLVVQSFQKVPALNAVAPKQTEPPFAIAQLALLLLFVVLGVMSVKRFRPADAAKSMSASAR